MHGTCPATLNRGGNAGMRDPVFPTDPVPAVTVFSGNQFQGGGNAGNQLQNGSAVLFKKATGTAWQTVPLIFATVIGNNKYYSAAIPAGAFPAGTIVQYYLRIAYDDHDTTFLQAAAGNMTSITTGNEAAARSAPFTFTIETPDKRGQWGAPFTLPNVGIRTAAAFNDLDPGQPVHITELWDPKTGHWTQLAAENTDRCYHSTAVLLPDGRVLSAGSGEFILNEGTPQQVANDPQDTHRDAQVFSPPYLFKGPRPEITSAPASVHYGDTFEIGTAQPGQIATISLIRLSSVTHSFNVGQRINFLPPQVEGGSLKATAPPNAKVCPPGHYMLFILNGQGVPSVAKIVQISAPAAAAVRALEAARPEALAAGTPASAQQAPRDAFALRAMVRDAARGTPVVVGIRGTCPYGIAACWGGADEALRSLEGVEYVDPIPDGDSSTATLYLEDDRLPPLDHWDEQFRQMVHETYVLRGVEVTLTGTIEARDGVFVLAGEGRRPPAELAPLDPGGKIQWDPAAGGPQAAEPGEASAYDTLTRSPGATGERPLTVTGPLHQTEAGYRLQVRLVEF